jgi:hypothetical protein
MQSVLSNGLLRQELIRKGKAKSAMYNWTASAQALNKVIALS